MGIPEFEDPGPRWDPGPGTQVGPGTQNAGGTRDAECKWDPDETQDTGPKTWDPGPDIFLMIFQFGNNFTLILIILSHTNFL